MKASDIAIIMNAIASLMVAAAKLTIAICIAIALVK